MFARLTRALKHLFGGGKEPVIGAGRRAFTLTVRCDKCGELIEVRIDQDHELQAEYDKDATEGARPTQYLLRKEIVGADCQNLIRLTIRFDADLHPLERTIEGGEFVEPEQE